MSREELDTYLQELTQEDITVDRQLEIFKAIQDDKDASLSRIDELTANVDKVIDDYKALKQKRVEDFFKRGVESKASEEAFNQDNLDKNENIITIDDILGEDDTNIITTGI